MKDDKQPERDPNPWIMVGRYSEIGFLIPAAVLVGYLLGLLADHLLHTHWIYLFGIIFGAISGFVSMIRHALAANADADAEDAASFGSNEAEAARRKNSAERPPEGPPEELP